MGTKSFRLEKTLHGTFLLQGCLGGILSGFVYTVAIGLWDKHVKFFDALVTAAFLIPFVSMLGVMKSIVMWAPYRLAKFQPRDLTRVAIISTISGVFAFVTGRLYSSDPANWVPWVITLLLGALPTSILVGSSVKPWELFTFGSIAGKRRRSVLGTLATLPLRFLSLLTLAGWILYFGCTFEPANWSIGKSLSFLLPAAYLLFSACVTFRSPPKVVLFITGWVANMPVVAFAIYGYKMHTEISWLTHEQLYVSVLRSLFVVSWVVFLVARLSVRTNDDALPLMFSNRGSLPHVDQQDHHCLGSRFLEWRERAAL